MNNKSPLFAAHLTRLLAAAAEVVARNGHDECCARREHFRSYTSLIPSRHTRRWKVAHAEAERTAPPCDCQFGRLAAALKAVQDSL